MPLWLFLPPLVTEEKGRGREEIEASEQGWWYTNYLVIFSPADSMYPVHQLGRDNRSILHMSVFL